jgi:hypothetical protein
MSQKKRKWGVYEYATGTVWQVNPPTKKNAKREAKLVAEQGDHEAVPLKWAWKMKNAYSHGRASALR